MEQRNPYHMTFPPPPQMPHWPLRPPESRGRVHQQTSNVQIPMPMPIPIIIYVSIHNQNKDSRCLRRSTSERCRIYSNLASSGALPNISSISPGSKSKVKSSVQRSLRTQLITVYPLLAPHIDEIVPKKEQLDAMKVYAIYYSPRSSRL
jgi:hypothetical protein